MLEADRPALILAPMEGITDAPVRALMGEFGAFSFAVSEFQRVAATPIPKKVFLREVPELEHGARTATGLPVQVQILGGHPDRMALSALAAIRAGATAIDINFGCPAPTVNRHDGGASLLQHPCRLREIVATVRSAVPAHIPVSAKIRLGWDDVDDVDANAAMVEEGGASWLTIHARSRSQGYKPPVFWDRIGRVNRRLEIPVVANGDIRTLDDCKECQEVTGCTHFMVGRAALACPALPHQIARELGIAQESRLSGDWPTVLSRLIHFMGPVPERGSVMRLKQWLKLASNLGTFHEFDSVKQFETTSDILRVLSALELSAAA